MAVVILKEYRREFQKQLDMFRNELDTKTQNFLYWLFIDSKGIEVDGWNIAKKEQEVIIDLCS